MSNPPSHPPPRPWTPLPRPLLLALAVIFCAATTVYALAWMYDVRHLRLHHVEIGINRSRDTFFDPQTSSITIFNVLTGGPAERAGLRADDRMVALNGNALTSYSQFDKLWSRSQPGDPVDITVRRSGERQPLTVHAIFRSAEPNSASEGRARASAREILGLYPIFFVLVGFAVLFLRLEDSHAWLLALLFACFVAAPNFNNRQALPGALNAFTMIYRDVFLSQITALLYIFFALFPEKSPLERRAPWLKWLAIAVGLSQFLSGLPFGDPRWPEFVGKLTGASASNYARHILTYAFLVLGLVSLAWNCYGSGTSHEARRKSRVLLAATLVGVLPAGGGRILFDFSDDVPPFWIDVGLTLLLLLYPLAFAYSIVKHRVLEIPVLLRRSARYVLVQRGYFLLLFCGAMAAIFLFTRFFSEYFAAHSQFGMTLSAVFGVALVWVSGPIVKRGTDRIDRAFFRSSYDARMILQDLAEKIRAVSDRRELAALLERQLPQAFHPESLA